MDIHVAQQAKGDTYARPRQPTDSPAAALPTETLQHIFALALEGEDQYQRQSTRILCSKVCYHWWSIVPSSFAEYAVQSGRQATRLAAHLKATNRGHSVRSLYVKLGEKGTNRSGQAATLLRRCNKIKKLSLHLERGLTGGDESLNETAAFGWALLDAMVALQDIVWVELKDMAYVNPAAFERMMKGWPNLHTLIHTPYYSSPLPLAPSLPLTTLNFRRLDCTPNSTFFKLLRHHRRSHSPLTSMTIRHIPLPTGGYYLADATHATDLLRFARSLSHFSAPDGWSSCAELDTLLQRMTKLKSIELYYDLFTSDRLHAIDLRPLVKLKELQITTDPKRFSLIGLTDAVARVSGRLPPSLKRLVLPAESAEAWKEWDAHEILSRGEDLGVKLVWR